MQVECGFAITDNQRLEAEQMNIINYLFEYNELDSQKNLTIKERSRIQNIQQYMRATHRKKAEEEINEASTVV